MAWNGLLFVEVFVVLGFLLTSNANHGFKKSFDTLFEKTMSSSFDFQNKFVSPDSFPVIVVVEVTYLGDDFTADPALCDPNGSQIGLYMCNLRSAWLYCTGLTDPFTLCVIELPDSYTLWFDSLQQGPLTMKSQNNIYIGGNNAIIESISFHPLSYYYYAPPDHQFIYYNNVTKFDYYHPPQHIPYLYITDLTIQNFVGSEENGYSPIYVEGYMNLTIESCTFVNNTAYAGGSITIVANPSYSFLLYNTFISNYAHSGGSIYIAFYMKSVLLLSNLFTDSMSSDGENIELQYVSCSMLTPFLLGGAIVIGRDNTEINIQNNVFDSCQARYDGGSIYMGRNNRKITISNCYFKYSIAGYGVYGGGSIFLGENSSSIIIDSSQFFQSYAELGGAIAGYNFNDNITITNSAFQSSYAINGGSIYLGEHNTKILIQHNQFFDSVADNPLAMPQGNGFGGSIYLSPMSDNIIIDDNYFEGGHAYCGGAISAEGGSVVIKNSTFQSCSSTSNGGSIIFLAQSKVQIIDCVFNSSAAGFVKNGFESTGGAINFEQVNVDINIKGCQFNQVSASSAGGAVYFGDNSQYINILDSQCTNAVAPQGGSCYYFDQGSKNIVLDKNYLANMKSTYSDGGAIVFYYDVAQAVLSNTLITNSYAGNAGGAVSISLNTRDIVFDNVTIKNSQANQAGGCLTLSSNASLVAYGLKLQNCVAQASSGGGIGLGAVASFEIHDSIIENCQSFQEGGAISFGGVANGVLINTTRISSNKAGGYGGGIFVSTAMNNARIIQSVIKQNKAPEGGGIFLNSKNNNFIVAGTVFEANAADDSGGGMYVVQQNYQLAVMSLEGYRGYTVLESPHPYVPAYPVNGKKQIIYKTNVSVAGAKGFVLNFDSQSSVDPSCVVIIFDCETKLSIQAYNNNWPGAEVPSLILNNTDSFCLEFVGPQDDTYNLVYGNYGFKLYVYPVMENPRHPTIFVRNVVNNYGGGFLSFYNNPDTVIVNTIFEENKSLNGDGGGAYFEVGNGIVTLDSVLFQQNVAQNNGGGMVLLSGIFGVILQNCLFDGNYNMKGYGGGLYFGTGNGVGVLNSFNYVAIGNVTFSNNIAAISGGAIYAASQNTIYSENVDIVNNTAISNGGGITMDTSNTMYCNSVTFYNNSAGKGGGFVSNNLNTLSFQNVYFLHNHATSGGGLIIQGGTILSISKLFVFQSNVASLAGGGMIISQSRIWTRSDASSASMGLNFTNLQNSTLFVGNVAAQGSALLLYQIVSSPSIITSNISNNGVHAVLFDSNIASIGGTVYWTYDSVMTTPPPQLSSVFVQFVNNHAPYGTKYATQGIQLITPINYNATVYSNPLSPPISMYMLDYYQQFIPISGETTVSASIMDNECDIHPYLSGSDLTGDGVAFLEGYASFAQLIAYCSPKGAFTLQFTAKLGSLSLGTADSAKQFYYIHNTTSVHFRDCVEGEYLVDGICAPCPLSTYNLQADYLQTECTSCSDVEGIDTCERNQIVVVVGYWRRHQTSSAVMPCMLSGDSCIGGNVTGEALCGVGYEGPLCAVCSDGYFLNDDKECTTCSTENNITPLTIVVMIVGFLAALIAGIYFFVEDSIVTVLLDEYVLFYWSEYDGLNELMDKCKIIVSTFQIIIPTAFIFNISYPPLFSQFCNAFSFLDFNILSLFSLSCATGYNYMDELLWTTLLPIFVSVLLFLSWCVQYMMIFYAYHKFVRATATETVTFRQRLAGIRKEKRYKEMTGQHLNYFFFLTYLVLPSVTTTIFQVFLCTNVDPNQEDNDEYDYYLTADMSISCQNSYYYNWVTYAIFMIFVYPIGIPALYLYLLYINRKEISERKLEDEEVRDEAEKSEGKEGNDEVVNENVESGQEANNNPEIISESLSTQSVFQQRRRSSTKSTGSKKDETSFKGAGNEKRSTENSSSSPSSESTKLINVEQLSFLWSSYSPKYWYWEIIETTRRIMLTAVLSVCGSGSSEQSVLAVLLALLYIKIYASYSPYLEKSNSVLAEIGQVQIFFTYFTALIIQNALLNGSLNSLLGFFLTISNLSVINYPIFVENLKAKDIAAARKLMGEIWTTIRTLGLLKAIDIHVLQRIHKQREEFIKEKQKEKTKAQHNDSNGDGNSIKRVDDIADRKETKGASVLATVLSPFFQGISKEKDINGEKGDIELAEISQDTNTSAVSIGAADSKGDKIREISL